MEPATQRVPLTGICASPLILKYDTPAGPLYIGNDGPFQTKRPGNGGLRIWTYPTEKEAVAECIALSSGMTGKHLVYNTGFSGAKLVVNCRDLKHINKRSLMRSVAVALKELAGAVYTGCDVNTSIADMEYLTSMCPYVLSSIDSPINPNIATGYGVFGSIQGALDRRGGVRDKTFLVVGVGKVGTTVCELLVRAGARAVLTHDIVPHRAALPGCTNVSDREWRKLECDVLVPCAVSGFLDEATAAALRCSAVVGATNVPFKCDEAKRLLESRGIAFIPESVSSAGAVLVDSIEHHDRAAYTTAQPSSAYAYVRSLTRAKTRQLMDVARRLQQAPSRVVERVMEDCNGPPVGALFSEWKAKNTIEYDVVVVGAGLAGASTAYYLSRDAPILRTALVEARTAAHAGGSSFGDSRMFRQMYSEEYFSKMQQAALELWHQLESEHKVKLLSQHGLLFYGDPDVGDTVQGNIPSARDVMDRVGIPYDHLDSSALQQRWPQLVAQPGYEGLFEPGAGHIHAGVACKTLVKAAVERGVQLLEDEGIEDIAVLQPGVVELATSQNRFLRARRVVMCVGAWTNDLLGHLGVQPFDLEIWAMHWGHYKVDPAVSANFPQWYFFRKPDASPGSIDEGLYYGFVADPATHTIKVGADFTPSTPDRRASSVLQLNFQPDPVMCGLVDTFMRSHWQGVGECTGIHVSPYTMTRDHRFILDRLPEHPEICLFTGGSGRAFKFGPLLGRCLADLTLGREPCHDIQPLSASRPAVRPIAARL